MSIVADVAQATGHTQRAIREELNRAAIADAVLQVVLARFWPHVSADTVAEVAGVSKADLSSAIVRYHDEHRREMVATQVAHRNATRKRHVPEGDPPSLQHRWCKRGSHWVHQDEMGRNRARVDGYGDWCKACWREYWRKYVKREKVVR